MELTAWRYLSLEGQTFHQPPFQSDDMLKRDEIDRPDSCLNKAGERELIFVLLARDPAFAATIRFWASKRCELGINYPTDSKIEKALELAAIAESGS